MREKWIRLIECGNKSVGTAQKLAAEELILGEMKKLSGEARLEEFQFDGWAIRGKPSLRITAPFDKQLPACVFLGSGGGSFQGEIRLLGINYVWNMYGWDRYAVLSGGRIVGYISGRQEGETLSQTLIEGNSLLPHFIVGEAENRLLQCLMEQGLRVCVNGKVDCGAVKDMRGANILLPLKALRPIRKKVLICAHYDTMYNTPGAYDNGAGTAVLMELAGQLAGSGLDRDIDILFTDAEECRLEGSRYYAQKTAADQLDYVINIDGIGRGDELEIWSGKEEFERRLAETLFAWTGVDKLICKNPPPPGSDHTPFYEKGIDCCMFTFNDQGILHTPLDVFEESKLKNMEKMLELVRFVLREI